jgi:hypothetical protein
MSRIVRVVNAMISNPAYIHKVDKDVDGKYLFQYKNYMWGIEVANQNDVDVCYLYFYPKWEGGQLWADPIDFIKYSTLQIDGREAYQSFFDLYNLVREKAFNVSQAFDDILKDF